MSVKPFTWFTPIFWGVFWRQGGRDEGRGRHTWGCYQVGSDYFFPFLHFLRGTYTVILALNHYLF